VLSHDDAGVRQRHLHELGTFSKTDIVHSTLRGAVVGIFGCALALLLPYLFGMTADIGWTPFVFMAIIALGISTWEGGLWGIQELNWHFRAFEPLLDRGEHVLIVDVARIHEDELDFEIAETQEDVLRDVASHHPLVQAAA
jgi:hypothetical protein